ncbi:hypothetical protein CWATWH8502_124 [Crocosphaera watsonii WH 8502]|uniref:Uncharacterized protein n=3 Tax=Crocosphaera watsonii TaxID=263511 RepID=G5JCP3_CROWT|nr:hypothetical protein CWATWH0003_5195 [Crocosphaera watsonii WH 0003]CCQ50876.1 hypothetical protein CWATWH8502_124 [Crocosphaera watsonii WH 8502]CCQ61594.1 hypothetical protein CWATWH0401_1282 [Crocosphaera watsonii WH 0401]
MHCFPEILGSLLIQQLEKSQSFGFYQTCYVKLLKKHSESLI